MAEIFNFPPKKVPKRGENAAADEVIDFYNVTMERAVIFAREHLKKHFSAAIKRDDDLDKLARVYAMMLIGALSEIVDTETVKAFEKSGDHAKYLKIVLSFEKK